MSRPNSRNRRHGPSRHELGRHRLTRLYGALVLLACTAVVFPSCSRGLSGGGGPQTTSNPPPPAVPTPAGTSLKTLSGTVLQPPANGIGLGVGLAGVTITTSNGESAVSDGAGHFIIHDPDPGSVQITLDGTGAGGATGARFAVFHTGATIGFTGATTFVDPFILTNLEAPGSSVGVAPVDPAGSGMTTAPIDVRGPNPDIVTTGPNGTFITLDGLPATQTVTIGATPVHPTRVPAPLGQSLDASTYVSVHPHEAAFDTGGGLGLDIVLPNDRRFRPGLLVDIWGFDFDTSSWVNLSAQTGNQGIVDPTGAKITASGVVVKGGCYAAAVPVDSTCATNVVGKVLDPDGIPIPGVRVATNTGQFATTDDNGDFRISSVPAYDASQLPGCAVIDVTLDLLTPLTLGGLSARETIDAIDVVPGRDTDAGDIEIALAVTGHLAGHVDDTGSPVASLPINIAGQATTTATTDANGNYFVTGLPEGEYTASMTFPGTMTQRVFLFDIEEEDFTTTIMQRHVGAGSETLTALVLFDHDDNTDSPMLPAEGAKVLMLGTDPLSAGGFSGVCNSDGVVTFEAVDGPFTVTAQLDTLVGASPLETRVATTILGLSPGQGVVGIPLIADLDRTSVSLDATLSGTVSNRPALQSGESISVRAEARGAGRFFDRSFFSGSAAVSSSRGTYSMSIPSDQVLDVMLVHEDCSGAFSCTPIEGAVAFGLGPAEESETIDKDFAFGAGSFDFDQLVNVTYNNLAPVSPSSTILGLFFGDGAGGEIGFTLASASATLPAAVLLPDLGSSLVSRYQASLEVALTFGSARLFCGQPLSTAQNVTFGFFEAPEIDNPSAGAGVSASQAAAMTIQFTEGIGGSGAPLFNRIELSSSQTALEPDRIEWDVFFPFGTHAGTLNPTALPMFAAGAGYDLKVETLEVIGLPASVEALFDGNVEQNLRNVRVRCGADDEISFSVQ